jgi:hypothetical protein
MSVILKKDYPNEEEYPILYVDTINESSYMTEMVSITVKWIRENLDEIRETKAINHIALTEQNIRTKKDGYWFVTNDKYKMLTLYRKKTILGYLWNTQVIEPIFVLRYTAIPKIVPMIGQKVSKYDSFVGELSQKVDQYRSRKDLEI